MSNISKLIGAVVGGLLGLLAIKFGMPSLSETGAVGQLIIEIGVPLITTAVAVYISPKNIE